MKKNTALDYITEAYNFGSCYIGSFETEFAEQTSKNIEKIERYVRKNMLNIRTEYKNVGTECYLVIK